jgi:hypothetical protein
LSSNSQCFSVRNWLADSGKERIARLKVSAGAQPLLASSASIKATGMPHD